MDIRALRRKLTRAEIEHEDLTGEIEEIKTEENVAKMWKKDPNNPINIAKAQAEAEASALANGGAPALGEDGQPIVPAEGANTAPVVAPVVAADGTVTEPVAGEPGAPELDKNVSSVVDEFEIQEDEIMQFKSAQENEQMKRDFEKKIEVLNSKLKFAEIELEKVLALKALHFIMFIFL